MKKLTEILDQIQEEIIIQMIGRRAYLGGNTYPFKDKIKSLGAHWDMEKKMWWTGKREDAEDLVAKLNAQPKQTEKLDKNDKVIQGRVRYKGKVYWMLKTGVSPKSGKPYCKMAFLDGSTVFWNTMDEPFDVFHTYKSPISINDIEAYAKKKAEYEKTTGQKLPAGTTPMSDAQRRLIRNLIRRVEGIEMFDSVSASGASIARQFDEIMENPMLTSKEASEIIEDLKNYIEDEM
jgi:hypothetical protein